MIRIDSLFTFPFNISISFFNNVISQTRIRLGLKIQSIIFIKAHIKLIIVTPKYNKINIGKYECFLSGYKKSTARDILKSILTKFLVIQKRLAHIYPNSDGHIRDDNYQTDQP